MAGLLPPGGVVPVPPVERPAWACPRAARVIGIDPGLKGYLAGLDDAGAAVWFAAIPTIPTGKGTKQAYDISACWDLVRSIPHHARVMLEKQQPYKAQGVTSTFSTGQGYMLWKALLTAGGLSWEEVSPQSWKANMGIKATAEERSNGKNAATKAAKARAITLARSLFPGVDLRDDRRKSDRAKAPCSDKAEAALLAEFYRRRLSGRG